MCMPKKISESERQRFKMKLLYLLSVHIYVCESLIENEAKLSGNGNSHHHHHQQQKKHQKEHNQHVK